MDFLRLKLKKLLFTSVFISSSAMATCLVDPLLNPVASSPFGKFRSAYGSTVHQGFDLVPHGSGRENIKLYATSAGNVVWADFRGGGYGNTVAIERTDEHAGDIVLYRHVRNLYPKTKGSTVNSGEIVGYMSGTRSSATDDNAYSKHLHIEYMTKKINSVQYEFNPTTKDITTKFINIGKKGLGDRYFIGRGLYYTDPAPYFCNAFPFQSKNLTGFGFNDTKEQYQFMMTKLGKDISSLNDYSVIAQQEYAKRACEAIQENIN
jgi:murein DD-endopeptidase MepM/ murein hydrolase activator NlpD